MRDNYYILDNAGQYYIILKCTEKQINNYFKFGHMHCISEEKAIDLVRMSRWLIDHSVSHTVVYNKINNLILRAIIKKDILYMTKMADLYGLLISDDEIEDLLNNNTRKNKIYIIE